jgi:hypothetical protein
MTTIPSGLLLGAVLLGVACYFFLVAPREQLGAPEKCIQRAIGLWNFKPGETSPFPGQFERRNGAFLQEFQVMGPEDFEAVLPLLRDFTVIQNRWREISPWVVKTDVARLAYVYLQGGFYFDSDCVITRNLPSTEEDEAVLFVETTIPWFLPLALVLGPREKKSPDRRTRIANYGFGAVEPRHPFFKACLHECERRLESVNCRSQNNTDTVWLCGPDVLTTVYHESKGAYKVRVLEKGYLKHLAAGSWR